MFTIKNKHVVEFRKSTNFIFQSILIFSLPLVDSAVLSFIGQDQAIAGSSIGVILGLAFTIIYASVFGASSYLSQASEISKSTFKKYYSSIIYTSLFIHSLVMMAYFFNINHFESFTGIYSVDIKLSQYLNYFVLISTLYWMSCLLDLILYNTGNDSVCLKLTSFEIPTNIILSITLGIFISSETFGGISGVAISSAIAKALKIVLCVLFLRKDNIVKELISFKTKLNYILNVSKKMTPFIITCSMWSMYGYISYQFILKLDYKDMFVFSLLIPWVNFCFTVPNGFSNYLSISLSKKISKESVSLNDLFGLVPIFLILISVVILLTCIIFQIIFIDKLSIASLKIELLVFMILFILSRSLNIFITNGVLKSGLDNYFVLLVDSIVMWVTCLPILIYISGQEYFSLTLVFIFYLFEELIKLYIYWRRVISLKWAVKLLEAV
ncbi:TPA: hypothetical protein ACPJ01_003449 [Vibrio diabolicus]